jgi:hypothetical protein
MRKKKTGGGEEKGNVPHCLTLYNKLGSHEGCHSPKHDIFLN